MSEKCFDSLWLFPCFEYWQHCEISKQINMDVCFLKNDTPQRNTDCSNSLKNCIITNQWSWIMNAKISTNLHDDLIHWDVCYEYYWKKDIYQNTTTSKFKWYLVKLLNCIEFDIRSAPDSSKEWTVYTRKNIIETTLNIWLQLRSEYRNLWYTVFIDKSWHLINQYEWDWVTIDWLLKKPHITTKRLAKALESQNKEFDLFLINQSAKKYWPEIIAWGMEQLSTLSIEVIEAQKILFNKIFTTHPLLDTPVLFNN